MHVSSFAVGTFCGQKNIQTVPGYNVDVFFSAAFMYYYDNPKGMIPTWLINWAAKVTDV